MANLEGMVVVASVKVKVELLKRWLGETASSEMVVKLGMLRHVATVLFVVSVIGISLMVLVYCVCFGYAHIKIEFLPTIFQQFFFFFEQFNNFYFSYTFLLIFFLSEKKKKIVIFEQHLRQFWYLIIFSTII